MNCFHKESKSKKFFCGGVGGWLGGWLGEWGEGGEE